MGTTEKAMFLRVLRRIEFLHDYLGWQPVILQERNNRKLMLDEIPMQSLLQDSNRIIIFF